MHSYVQIFPPWSLVPENVVQHIIDLEQADRERSRLRPQHSPGYCGVWAIWTRAWTHAYVRACFGRPHSPYTQLIILIHLYANAFVLCSNTRLTQVDPMLECAAYMPLEIECNTSAEVLLTMAILELAIANILWHVFHLLVWHFKYGLKGLRYSDS